MKKLFIIFTVLWFCSASLVAQDSWSNFTSEAGNYSLTVYGEVSEQFEEMEDRKSFKLLYEHDGMNYMINTAEHVTDLESNIDELLNVSLTSFNGSVKGTITEEKEIYQDGVKGKYAFILVDNEVYIMEYYVFIKGFFQYQFVIFGKSEVYEQDKADLVRLSLRFLD